MAVAAPPEQADGAMPARTKPACPCPRCEAEYAAASTSPHGAMLRYEAGCRCGECRLWSTFFNRALRAENAGGKPRGFNGRAAAYLREMLAPDTFDPEPEAEPQPTQGSGAGTSAGNLLRRLWQRR